jgi:hypothetical protein
MLSKRRTLIAVVSVAFAATLATFWASSRHYSNGVNLDVQNMEVRSVVKKVEKQTGVTVIISDAVQGKLTLFLHDTPVELALELIARQVSARAGHVYPIYNSPAALTDLKALITAQTAHPQDFERWTNFSFHHAPGCTGRLKKKVNVHVDHREARLAAMAASYAVHAQVVTQDGLAQPVKLELDHGTPDQVVAELARALNSSWSSLYYLRPAKLGRTGTKTEDQKLEHKEAKREAISKEKRERKEQLQTLRPEEKAVLTELRSQDPAFQERMSEHALNKLRESTPEQIVEHRRENLKPGKKSPHRLR